MKKDFKNKLVIFLRWIFIIPGATLMGSLFTGVILYKKFYFFGVDFIFLQRIVSAALFPFAYLGIGVLIAPYYKKQVLYLLLMLFFLVTCIGLINQNHTLSIIERIISLISGVICTLIYNRNMKDFT